jgi:transcriptional regulator with XRE-family HTH domain
MTKRRQAGAPFGARLRSLREAAGLSQRQLADAAGMSSKAHVWRLEAGQREPTWALLCRLADALGCRLDEFRG